jgi:hypothetical protein
MDAKYNVASGLNALVDHRARYSHTYQSALQSEISFLDQQIIAELVLQVHRRLFNVRLQYADCDKGRMEEDKS